MKKVLMQSGMALTVLGVGLTTRAQNDSDFWSRFSLGYQAVLNIKASFSGVGAYAPPGSPGSGLYNDGFVDVNAGPLTTHWGYNSASQISGGNLLLDSSSSSAVNAGREDAGPQSGFEFTYDQPLGGGRHWRWGLEAAASWTSVGFTDNRPLSGNVVTTTDAYPLNGVIPPPAPYSGPASGPGPLLGTTPGSHTVGAPQAGAADITGSREIAADLYGFRLGPYLELPLCRHFSIGLSGGVSVGVLHSDFSYNETVSVAGLPTQTEEGRSHKDAGRAGGYARAQANVRLTRTVSAFASAEFNDLGTFNQTVGGQTAHLDLSQVVFLSGGLSFRF